MTDPPPNLFLRRRTRPTAPSRTRPHTVAVTAKNKFPTEQNPRNIQSLRHHRSPAESSPWSSDLKHLQSETTNILQRYGSAAKSRRAAGNARTSSVAMSSSPLRYGPRGGPRTTQARRHSLSPPKRSLSRQSGPKGVTIASEMSASFSIKPAKYESDGYLEKKNAGLARRVSGRTGICEPASTCANRPRQGRATTAESEEKHQRHLDFKYEERRVRLDNDTFITRHETNLAQLQKEQERLRLIQDLSERKTAERDRERLDKNCRRRGFKRDSAAIAIQRLFRGRLGRRRFSVTLALSKISRTSHAQWIEVRDEDTEDVWYYNKQTGESTWDAPDVLEGVTTAAHRRMVLPPLTAPRNMSRASSCLRGGNDRRASTAPSLKFNSVSSKSSSVSFGGLPVLKQNNYGSSDTAVTSDSFDKDIVKDEFTDDMNSHDIDFDQQRQRIFSADGRVNPRLRQTITSVLRTSPFDSISSLLASGRSKSTVIPTKKNKHGQTANKKRVQSCPPSLFRHGGKRMVSVVRVEDEKDNHLPAKNKRSPTKLISTGTKLKNMGSLSLRDVAYTGFDTGKNIKNDQTQSTDGVKKNVTAKQISGKTITRRKSRGVCFNCWSAGNGKHCVLHKDGSSDGRATTKHRESSLMCQNWDIGVLRRRYRSEDIQEVFMKSSSSLRYDKDHKQFQTVVEQKHPIYRLLVHHIAKANFWSRRKRRVRYWFRSFIDLLKLGKIPGKTNASVKMLRLKKTVSNLYFVRELTKNVRLHHPAPSTTGSSYEEIRGTLEVLVERNVQEGIATVKRKFIIAGPTPIPRALYLPRKYELFSPNTVPIPDADLVVNVMASTRKFHLDAKDPFAWAERLTLRVVRDGMYQAWVTIAATLPVPQLNAPTHGGVHRSCSLVPKTNKSATFRRTPTPDNVAVGGLSAELIISQLVCTYVPPRYGNFSCQDRTAAIPAVGPEVTTFFETAAVDPANQIFVDRALVSPQNDRRAPTVMTLTGIDRNDGHHFGLNRPDQTGETEFFGFRTSAWAPAYDLDGSIDASTFVPAQGVATLNAPAENKPILTHANLNYPFREPTNRVYSTKHFHDLLIVNSACTLNKAQIFSSSGEQGSGHFMRGCDSKGPLGPFRSTVTRSWAFTQNKRVEEFITDGGVSYWYDHRTGETFWERPLYEEEKACVKEGGVILETAPKSKDASDPNNDRFHVRKLILHAHETEESKVARIRAIKRACASSLHQLPLSHTKDENATSEAMMESVSNMEKKDAKEDREETIICNIRDDVFETEDDYEITQTPLEQEKNSNDSNRMDYDNSETNAAAQNDSSKKDNTSKISQHKLLHTDLSQTEQLVKSITNALSGTLSDFSNTEDMLKFGMGLGMALGAQGLLSGQVIENSTDTFPISLTKEKTEPIELEVIDSSVEGTKIHPVQANLKCHPIGLPNPTKNNNEAVTLDHSEEEAQTVRIKKELSAVKESDCFKGVTVMDPTPTPDEMVSISPTNIDSEATNGTDNGDRVGPIESNFETFRGAGLGTTFVPKSEEDSQTKIYADKGVEIRKSSNVLPVGFAGAISARRVCKQYVDYLPSIPNLPQSKPVGRVKPRAAGEDWLSIGFDPWSAGKEPLTSEFVATLNVKAERLQNVEPSRHKSEQPFIDLLDRDGLENDAAVSSKESQMALDFREICSYVRHGKYRELEDKMNDPDWDLSIEYTDTAANTLLMISCQNGNKRIAKLCLRKGAIINKQNINGQTCLHYAFGYGFDELGEYLISKGADDGMFNADGLTCYEGLNMETVSAI